MGLKLRIRAAVFAAAAALALCGCSGGSGDRPAQGAQAEGGVDITACFRREGGDGLLEGAVRLTAGGEQARYPLEGGGELALTGLPRNGEVELAVLDPQDQILGTVLLSIAEGAVIDAATDETGSVHITLKEDTAEIALLFVLQSDGALSCALQLTQMGQGGG